jgi:D-aminoacyl-tRNA deacylase
MRAVVQRVLRAGVTVDDQIVGSIEHGVCALIGVGKQDSERDVEALVNKLCMLRIFKDAGGKMNLSLGDVGGALLAVSQFTLFGDARRGQRPSFTDAMEPLQAAQLFDRVCQGVRARGITVATGRFGASMQVELVNDGPVTILLDTQKLF